MATVFIIGFIISPVLGLLSALYVHYLVFSQSSSQHAAEQKVASQIATLTSGNLSALRSYDMWQTKSFM